MIDTNSFEMLLEKSETSILDFKKEIYDFDDDRDYVKTSKFVKDVISFSNTVRTETSYIIIGVNSKEDGVKELIGLNKNIDEAILQAKIKDKIFPIPHFSYYTITYNNLSFGIFEFQVRKYETPLSPTVAMKGLKVGMPYYRKGSSNEEAIGSVLININDWMKSLPSISNDESYTNSVSNVLKKAINTELKLSEVLVETLSIAKKYELIELKEFCIDQLNGIPNPTDNSKYKYRIHKTVFCCGWVQSVSNGVTASMIKEHLKKENNYFEFNIFYGNSISSIELSIDKTKSNTAFNILTTTANKVFPEKSEPDTEITFYIFNETYNKLYNSIRQTLIEILVAI